METNEKLSLARLLDAETWQLMVAMFRKKQETMKAGTLLHFAMIAI